MKFLVYCYYWAKWYCYRYFWYVMLYLFIFWLGYCLGVWDINLTIQGAP